jgi:hypothetical protein
MVYYTCKSTPIHPGYNTQATSEAPVKCRRLLHEWGLGKGQIEEAFPANTERPLQTCDLMTQ